MQRLHLDLGDDGDRLLSLTSRSALIGGRRSVISDRLVGEHRLVIRPARENSSSLSRRSRTRTRTLRARAIHLGAATQDSLHSWAEEDSLRA